MSRTDECDSAFTQGRLSKAIEFFDAAEDLEDDMPNAAGEFFVDSGIASSDVVCCVRLGKHSSSANHNDAVSLLKQAQVGFERYLSTLLGLKNKAAYTEEKLSAAECKKMNRAASHLLEAAKRAVASTG